MGIGERDQPSEIPPCGCAVPGDVSAAVCYCAVDDLLRIIRRRYSLAVMNAIHSRERRRGASIDRSAIAPARDAHVTCI